MKLRWLWWLGIALIVAGAVWWLYSRFGPSSEVETTRVQRGEVVEELVLAGQVMAAEYAKLHFLSGGRLYYLAVSEGDRVDKGQLLARQDPTALQTAVTAAHNRWLAAQANAEEVEDEVSGNDDDESFEQKNQRVAAQTARDTAYFEWQQAVRNLRNADIRAPFAGVVTKITHPYTQINTSAAESQIELLNPESIYFSVNADQVEVGELEVGQDVEVVLDSDQDRTFRGRISQVGLTPVEGAAGVVYEVQVDFAGMTPQLRIGMTGDATLVVGRAENSLWLPPRYINTDQEGDYIITDRQGTKKYVTVGVQGEERYEVEGDVAEGDVVYD